MVRIPSSLQNKTQFRVLIKICTHSLRYRKICPDLISMQLWYEDAFLGEYEKEMNANFSIVEILVSCKCIVDCDIHILPSEVLKRPSQDLLSTHSILYFSRSNQRHKIVIKVLR
ncbi:hypothetical protein O6H91_Y204400 [Diphasiastrum complanatum]|nr:hypothetical protein O6H91_Y204400 [Diphasiastrum complanatum]